MTRIPKKLKPGSHIRVIAPSSSMAIISKENKMLANERLMSLGFKVSFGSRADESNDFHSSSVASRLEDFHEAFADPSVDAVFAVIGGFNCNQLLSYIDWKLVKKNPKIFIGYSDTDALHNAIYSMCGFITYCGPAWSTFAQEKYFDYTMDYFKKCLMENVPFSIVPSQKWTDDRWYMDQENRQLIENKGWTVVNEGDAEGTIVGCNLCTLNLLQGTRYFPDLKGTILFLEDDEASNPFLFDRDLQSLIHQKGFDQVRGLVIGRFQKASKMELGLLRQIIQSKKELARIPVLVDIDFGHTSPMVTLPIGGSARISAHSDKSSIDIVVH